MTAMPAKAVQTKADCATCRSFKEALDPNIKRAYLGYCTKTHWPFHEMIPLSGLEESCSLYEENHKK